MPCMCWYDPGEGPKKLIKTHCQAIVDEIKRLEKEGDPIDVSLKQAQQLLEHLYNPSSCEEKDEDYQR